MPVLSVVSVCWNHGGDAGTGSLNFHMGGPQSPAGMEFSSPAGGGSIDGTAVFVPSYLNNPYLLVKVYYPPGAAGAHTVNLNVVETQASHLFSSIGQVQFSITPGSTSTARLPFRMVSFLQTPGKNLCTFCINDGTVQIAVHRLTIYLLPALPAPPWNRTLGQYSPAQPDYLRTDFLDLFLPVPPAVFSPSVVIETLNRSGMYYDTQQGAAQYADGANRFKVQKFLNTYAMPVKGKLNCTDCAVICSSACAAVGIIFPMAVYNAGSLPGFKCNQIIAIGVNVWAEPFGGGGFSYHQFNVAPGTTTLDKDTQIYDACLKVDSGLYPNLPDKQTQKTSLLPCGYTASATNNAVVNISAPYSGQYYRERLAKNGEKCGFLQSVMQVPGISTIVTKQEKMKRDNPYRQLLAATAEKYQLESWSEADSIPAEEPAQPAELFASAELTDSGDGFAERIINRNGVVYSICHYWETGQLNGSLLPASVLAHIEAPVQENLKQQLGERSFTVNGTGYVFIRNRQVFHVYAQDGSDAYAVALQLDQSL